VRARVRDILIVRNLSTMSTMRVLGVTIAVKVLYTLSLDLRLIVFLRINRYRLALESPLK